MLSFLKKEKVLVFEVWCAFNSIIKKKFKIWTRMPEPDTLTTVSRKVLLLIVKVKIMADNSQL
jgi:hypothetical protein